MASRKKSLHELKNTPRELAQYVVAGEKIVFATRRHWAQIIEPVGTALLGLLVILAVAMIAPNMPIGFLDGLFVIWFVVLLRAAFYTLLWWTDWFVATTSRLLLSSGIIYKKVSMMPLAKVTDMSYNRTVSGRILGFGQFLLESAGQDQAFSRIDYVPNSGELYRQICSEIFHKKVANQAYRPVAMLGRQHRVSDERGFEPWEVGGGNLDIDERPAATFPEAPAPASRRPNDHATRRIDLGPTPQRPARLRPVPLDEDEDQYDTDYDD